MFLIILLLWPCLNPVHSDRRIVGQNVARFSSVVTQLRWMPISPVGRKFGDGSLTRPVSSLRLGNEVGELGADAGFCGTPERAVHVGVDDLHDVTGFDVGRGVTEQA